MLNKSQKKLIVAMGKFALRYPDAVEGIACAGTAIESRTIKAKTKAFLFLRDKEARLKVSTSLAEVKMFADREPECYEVGSGGWMKICFENGASPPLDVVKRWIDDSFRAVATKTLVRRLNEKPLLK